MNGIGKNSANYLANRFGRIGLDENVDILENSKAEDVSGIEHGRFAIH